MRTLQRTVIALVALCCTLALPSAAAAQSSEGAQVIDVAGCETTLIRTTVCFEGRLIINTTQTPSGVMSVTLINDIDQVLVDGPCAGSTIDTRYVIHRVVTVEGEQQYYRIGVSRSEAQCGGVTWTCKDWIVVHVVDGRLVFDRYELVCTEPESP